MNPHLLIAIKTLLGAVQIVSPALAGRLAFNLFTLVPPGRAPNDRERRLLGSAAGRMSRSERIDIPFENGHLATWRFRPDPDQNTGKRVALLHGFTSRASHLAAFVDPLLEAGFEVIALDFPAHGESSGRTIHVPKGVHALQAAHEDTGPWHGVVAHSFGGALAVTALSGTLPKYKAIPVHRLVLIAAPENIRTLFEGFGRFLGLKQKTQVAMNAMVRRIASVPIDVFKGGEQLRAPDRPTLVIHSSDDREVDSSHADAFLEAGAHMRSLRLDDLGHRRILYSPVVIDAAVQHLQEA